MYWFDSFIYQYDCHSSIIIISSSVGNTKSSLVTSLMFIIQFCCMVLKVLSELCLGWLQISPSLSHMKRIQSYFSLSLPGASALPEIRSVIEVVLQSLHKRHFFLSHLIFSKSKSEATNLVFDLRKCKELFSLKVILLGRHISKLQQIYLNLLFGDSWNLNKICSVGVLSLNQPSRLFYFFSLF